MPTNINCPDCGSHIAADDLNIAKDIALCRTCDKVFSVSATLEVDDDAPAITGTPPGAYYQDTPDGWVVGATTRNAMAFFLIPFTLVWAGGSLTGIYGSQIMKGHFQLGQSLFGLPFLIGSIFLITMTLMTSAGKIEIRRSGDTLESFIGVGGVGLSRRFPWSEIRCFSSEPWSTNDNGRTNYAICVIMKSGEKKKLAGMASRFRLDYIHAILAKKKREAAAAAGHILASALISKS